MIAWNRESSVNCSSSNKVLKPCFAKDEALRIWSPLLAAADNGIRILGLRKARISQIEFAPALEMIRSATANKWRSGALTYSYCTYPGVPIRDSSRWPLPQICITWKFVRSRGRILRTAWLTVTEPRLPPITKMIGLSAERWVY